MFSILCLEHIESNYKKSQSNNMEKMSSSNHIRLSRSIIINASSKKVWTTLAAFSGNEKFNPLVTSSSLDGNGIGSKRTCYVTLDAGRTVIKTIETLTSLNEKDKIMEYQVLSAPNTSFEGLINRVKVNTIKEADSVCSVEFTGSLMVKDQKSKIRIEKILEDAYAGILTGLKKMHEKE